MHQNDHDEVRNSANRFDILKNVKHYKEDCSIDSI